jgi:hypothetical protein
MTRKNGRLKHGAVRVTASRLLVTIVSLIALISAARSQPYPNRPVRLIVPFAPGGPPDVVGRPVTQYLNVQTGQPFVVENRPGADGVMSAKCASASISWGCVLPALRLQSSSLSSPNRRAGLPNLSKLRELNLNRVDMVSSAMRHVLS